MKLAILLLFIMPAIILAQDQPIGPIFKPPIDYGVDTRIIPSAVEVLKQKLNLLNFKSKITVVAPYTIRHGKPYNIFVRGFGIKRTTRLDIRITGKNDLGESVSIKRTAVLSRHNSKASIKIDAFRIPKGSYILTVRGDKFSEKRTLTYSTKNKSFLIQLSKGIFTPDSLVQFRVYAFDSETRSINPKSTSSFSISDPKGNLVYSSTNVLFIKGIFEGDFKLSKKASLGIWTLSFASENEALTKDFQVDEYQLPLIDGKLSIQDQTPYSSRKVSVTVDVSYTSGGGASGTAQVIIEQSGQNIIQKLITLNSGSATFDLDIVNDLNLNSPQYGYFDANLSFKDGLTGIKITDTKSFSIVPYSYYFITNAASNIKPRSPLKFTVTMRKYDGSPAPAGTIVQVIPENPNTISNQTLTLGTEGTVTSSVNVPADTEYILLRTTSKDTQDGYVSGSIYYRSTDAFLTLEVLTEKPKLNEPVKLRLTSGNQIAYAMIHIVSKGVLLESFRVFFDSDPNTLEFEFNPSFKYAPVSQIIAYYIDEKGDFITTQAYVQLNNDLPNYLKIEPVESIVKPGSNVTFKIESNIGSRVTLGVVDMRAAMLRDGFFFSKQNVFEALQPYTWNNIQYDFKSASYDYAFGSVGLFMMTNIPRPRKIVYPEMERGDKPKAEVISGGVKVREDFSEVPIWTKIDIKRLDSKYRSIEMFTGKISESITKYLIYGVSSNSYYGMGLTDLVPSVTTFLPFSLSVETPYAIKRDEVLQQNIYLFNFLKKSQTVVIQITKDSKFEGVDLKIDGWTDSSGFYTKNISTVVGQHIKLTFKLRSHYLGYVPFEITAKGPLAGDGIKKYIRVIPEGIARYKTKSVFIAIEDSSNTIDTTLQCDLPDSAYQDTTEISATVVGDIFGKTMNNLDKLIQMPGGCGEQTMLTLAPIIAVYKYLEAVNKLTPTLRSTLVNYITGGYQNELRYQRNDGSFSAFGEQDPSGSVWLSAYVAENFYLAKDIINIDLNTIKRAADFVAQQQQTNGTFLEPGRVIHTDMQGGAGNGIALTAYCSILFTMINTEFSEYTTVRNNSIAYLENNYGTITSPYELGIITYALHLAGSNQASAAYDLFYVMGTETSEHIFWEIPNPPSTNQPSSLTTENTAYGLLNVLLKEGHMPSVLKIVKYILSQSNSFGGYTSSQETVMALIALSQFARTFVLESNVNLNLTPDVGPAFSTIVDSTNSFTVQSFELNSLARSLRVEASSRSSGLAIASLTCNFYEDPTKVVPAFAVFTNTTFACTYRIAFDVCARYIPTGTSNMAIMVVNLPSGYVYSQWWGVNNPMVSQTETSNQGSTVTFYFNSISNHVTCVSVNAYRSTYVADLKDGNIIVTDYYNTALEGTATYPVGNVDQPCYYYSIN